MSVFEYHLSLCPSKQNWMLALATFCVTFSLRMDIYGGDEDTKKPWTEQETLLLLEVRNKTMSF